MDFYNLVVNGAKIEITPHRKDMDGFSSACFFYKEGKLWSSCNRTTIPRFDISPDRFNEHIIQMIDEHFKVAIYG